MFKLDDYIRLGKSLSVKRWHFLFTFVCIGRQTNNFQIFCESNRTYVPKWSDTYDFHYWLLSFIYIILYNSIIYAYMYIFQVNIR